MSGTLQFEPEALSSAISILRQATSSITTSLSTLESRSRALGSQWSGEAAQAYSSAHTSWTADLAEMNAVLAAAVEALSAAKGDYDAAEKANAERWRG